MRDLRGPYVVLVTPLDERGRQDVESLRRLVDYYIGSGVAGLTILGESSEVEGLSEAEKEENVDTVMKRCEGKIPVVIGTSRESTNSAIAAAEWAESKGASAVMVAPPKNPKLTDEKILTHFARIGDDLNVPMIVQDYPATNHPYMSPGLIAKISAEVSNAQYLKLEDPPTPMKLSKVNEATGGKLRIFGALGGKGMLWDLDRGAVGVMTASPTPEYLVEIWNAHEKGDRTRAKEIFYYNLPLIHSYSEIGISVRKSILVDRHVIRTAEMKAPAGQLDSKAREEIRELLNWVENNVLKATGVSPIRLRNT